MTVLTIVTILALTLIAPANISAQEDDLVLAKDANFSNISDEFSPGQTIYIKVKADSDGSKKKQLNLRDSSYSLITSYTFDYAGANEFRKTITAPQNPGYYSLEARIESKDSVSTQVQTIEVGNSPNSSINIDVSARSGGQSISGNTASPSPSPAVTSTPDASPSVEPTPQVDSQEPDEQGFSESKSFFEKIKEVLGGVLKIFWKF